MRIIVYDIEVFKYDWIGVFYDISRDEWYELHNDHVSMFQIMTQQGVIFCGFNNKHYDNHVTKAISCGADNTLVKQINDFIIEYGRNGWEHFFLKKNYLYFDSFDLMDDTQVGTSLKHIEAHLGMDIEETEVDFNTDRPLTSEEIQKTFFYCRHDVKATAKLLTLRKNYLECKINLGSMCSTPLPAAKALYFTNARLTAKYLDATYVQRYDGREYVYPANLNRQLIPTEVLDFFEQIWDMSIPDDVLFKRKLDTTIGGCPVTYAWGGVHGSLTQYHEKATAKRKIKNRDVSSLYPSLLIKYNYISRNCADPLKFEHTYDERIAAKHRGDKKVAGTLKNPLNVTSGAMDQPTNDLYDPLNARSMRISGQLFLTELVVQLIEGCPSFRLINFNTDGLMYSIDEEDEVEENRICDEWQLNSRFELETDHISECWVKDINNLMFVDTDGHIKTVGGYLNYGIAEKGAWKINNDHTIVKDAVIAYFAYGTPVEETIGSCNDMFKFQIIAKAGGGYKACYRVPPDFEERKKAWQKENRYKNPDAKKWIVPTMKWHNYDGPRSAVQKVNRVYASTNPKMGTIVKVKPDGTVGKIGGLPESCIIDNKNKLSISDVDKSWYVDLAKKYIEDFTGEKYD